MVLDILFERTTPLKILPLMETWEVNGHFLSTYDPSMAACGVLKPLYNKNEENTLTILTKSNSSVVSWEVGLLLGEKFL